MLIYWMRPILSRKMTRPKEGEAGLEPSFLLQRPLTGATTVLGEGDMWVAHRLSIKARAGLYMQA